MIATQPKSRQILGVNQQSYQSLKASMELRLRRQLLIAVCDSVVMQNQLATQLETDIVRSRAAARFLPGRFEDVEVEEVYQDQRSAPLGQQSLARLVFDSEDGNLPKQVAQWVRQTALAEGVLPQVQVLGIEQMTRQPAITQNHFLRSLEKIDALLPRLNTSLLIWVPWPWLRTIQQSAPTFWNWRSGVFEFVSDPTPVGVDERPLASDQQSTPDSASPVKPAMPIKLIEAVPEDEDDLSSLFDEEAAPVEPPITGIVPISRPIAKPVSSTDAQRSLPHRSLATSDRSTSIVTQGSNADIETTATRVNHSAERIGHFNVNQTKADRIQLDSAEDSTEPNSTENRSQTLSARAVSATKAEDPLANGRAYRSQIENGDRTLAVIESAIAAYESGLSELDETSSDWSAGLNDLGTLYWLKAQQADDSQQSLESMTRSIELYQDALKRLQPNQSDLVGQLYSNLGAVYSMLATYENSADYLDRAIGAYRQALPTCSLETDPLEYATLHNSLGSVYWKLSHYDRPQSSLQNAIAAYHNALSGYRPDIQPLDYAAVQNNLGITYWSLAKHEDPAGCLKQAIAAYRDALNYRTPDADPAACAITYNNLALAYWDLSKVSGLEQSKAIQAQRNAVTAFEAALNVNRNSGALSNMDTTAIYHCLGDVHGQMAEMVTSAEEIKDSLAKALFSYIQSLEGISDTAPTYTGRIGAIVANLRSHYQHLGLEGQQTALNKVPSSLISQVLAAL